MLYYNEIKNPKTLDKERFLLYLCGVIFIS